MALDTIAIKQLRGTTAENNAFIGADGVITVDTDLHNIRVHDGVTSGGHATMKASDFVDLTTQVNTNTANISTNTTNIATNASDITTLEGRVTVNEASIVDLDTTKAELNGDVLQDFSAATSKANVLEVGAELNNADSVIKFWDDTNEVFRTIKWDHILGMFVLENANGIYVPFTNAFIGFQASGGTRQLSNVITGFTVDIDSYNYFNTSTGRFTPQTPGYYEVSLSTYTNTDVSSANPYYITKNDVTIKNVLGQGGGLDGTTGTIIVYLNGSTDFIDFRQVDTLTYATNITVSAKFIGV